MENVRNRCKIEFIKRSDNEKIIKQQSNLTVNGIHKSYENCDNYTFEKNEVLIDRPIYIRFAIIQLSKLLLYETYYDNLQPHFRGKKLYLQIIGSESFVLCMNTHDINKDPKNLEN